MGATATVSLLIFAHLFLSLAAWVCVCVLEISVIALKSQKPEERRKREGSSTTTTTSQEEDQEVLQRESRWGGG